MTAAKFTGDAVERYREVVNALRVSLEQNDVTAARPLLREILGPITAVPTEAEGERLLTAHFPGMSAEEESLLSLANGTMVAGAGFVCSMAAIELPAVVLPVRNCERSRPIRAFRAFRGAANLFAG
jgi:hypothetical protein